MSSTCLFLLPANSKQSSCKETNSVRNDKGLNEIKPEDNKAELKREEAQYANISMYNKAHRYEKTGPSEKPNNSTIGSNDIDVHVANSHDATPPRKESPDVTSSNPQTNPQPEEHIYSNTQVTRVKTDTVNIEDFEVYVNKMKADVNPFNAEYDVSSQNNTGDATEKSIQKRDKLHTPS